MATDYPRHAVTEAGAEAYTGFSRRTLQKWRVTGGGPRYIQINRSIRYLLLDLDAFLAAGARRSTSESR